MENQRLYFPQDNTYNFYHDLKQRIGSRMHKIRWKVSLVTWFKILLFLLLYILTYAILLTSAQELWHLYLTYAVFGFLMPLTVVNIVHDAVHGSLLKSKKGNFIARHVFDVIGGNSFVWQKRHVTFHHPHPNILDWDIDLESRKIYTLSPADQHKRYHRYQHFYMPFVFPLFTLHWVLFRDFKDYYDPSSMFRRKIDIPRIEFIKLPIFKAVYIFHILILPMTILYFPWYHIAGAFVGLHIIAAIGALLILLPNHWDENVEFHQPGSDNRMPESWAIHQLKSTNDFAIYNPITNFLMGGLNHHVAHHLFPSINHNYLPTITNEVIKIAKEKGLPYKCFSLVEAIRTHFRLLKKNGFRYGLLETFS